MSAPALVPLVCPRCGETLRGVQQDILFRCGGCGRFLEAAGEGYVERAGATARPSAAGLRPSLHLPMWAFRVQTKSTWADPEREAEASLIAPIPWVYVTGFSLHNPFYFGDPGLIFTERRVELTAGEPVPVFGGVRGLEAAAAFVHSHVLTILDRRVDVTGLDLACTIVEARVWAVPFLEKDDVVEDAILGLRLPAAALNDLTALTALLKTMPRG
ncbi:MAG: hypothetical protein ACE147_17095 [Candidatus Methylomirabilales bacterium]